MKKALLVAYDGELNGLCATDTHLVYKWDNETCKILISMTRHGNAMSCHFSSDKKGLRKIADALNDGVEFIFSNFEWCEMILAKVERKSVQKLMNRVGFNYFADSENCKVYLRVKNNG